MQITSAKPLENYKLDLKFTSGESGTVDLAHLAGRGVFEAWLKPGIFEQVSISEVGALQWPGELDLCPDAMYLQMTGKNAAEVFQARDALSHA